jgi:hypothetical protein
LRLEAHRKHGPHRHSPATSCARRASSGAAIAPTAAGTFRSRWRVTIPITVSSGRVDRLDRRCVLLIPERQACLDLASNPGSSDVAKGGTPREGGESI